MGERFLEGQGEEKGKREKGKRNKQLGVFIKVEKICSND